MKNIFTTLTDYLRGVLSDSLDDIAPELRVSPGFDGFARIFDKEFSLCANYPKGHGELCECTTWYYLATATKKPYE